MKESDYILATNLAHVRAIKGILGALMPTKMLPAESIKSFTQWVSRMEIKLSNEVAKS